MNLQIAAAERGSRRLEEFFDAFLPEGDLPFSNTSQRSIKRGARG